MKRLRILFVHEVNWLTKPTFEIHELPELLSVNGHTIDFVDFPEGVERSGLRRLLDLQTTIKMVENRTYDSSKLEIYTPGRVFSRPFDRLVASFTFVPLLIRMLRKHAYDAIFLYSVPTNGWQTAIVARLFRVPLIYRGIDVPHAIRETRLAWAVRITERIVLNLSNKISVNNHALGEYSSKIVRDRVKVSVNYPGVDFVHFSSPGAQQDFRRSLGFNPTDEIIVYIGTLFRFSGLDLVLKQLSQYRETNPNIRLMIVGDGEQRETLERLVSELKLDDAVTFTGMVPYKYLPQYLSSSNLAIMPFERNIASNLALPWKVVQYIASGLPVVATRLDGLESTLVDQAGLVYVNNPTDVLPRALELLSSPHQCSEIVVKGLCAVRTKFDWVTNIEEFENLFNFDNDF